MLYVLYIFLAVLVQFLVALAQLNLKIGSTGVSLNKPLIHNLKNKHILASIFLFLLVPVLSIIIMRIIDFSVFYKAIEKSVQDKYVPKQRVLDRTIVYMFEMLYRTINMQENIKDENLPKEFFTIVPRGECLDLFLQLVKEYCMGDAEIDKHTQKMGPMIELYRTDNVIHWSALYESDAFKSYLTGLLNLILTRLHKDQKPIPALENKMPIKYQPYRINAFLNQVCMLWQNQPIDFLKKK